MDWFSWLSKTTLDPSLTYEYGLTFARNELQEEDLAYFNHEFLQSMGISIAKHRLEILKLAKKKETGGGGRRRNHALTRLILAVNKTRKRLTKCVSTKLNFVNDPMPAAISNPPPFRAQWKGQKSMSRHNKSWTERDDDRMVHISVSPKVSGPLDRRVHDRLMLTNTKPKVVSGPLDGRAATAHVVIRNRSPKVASGPLDGMVQEKLVITNKSPIVSGPLDGKVQETLMITNKNPWVSGPLDGRFGSPKAYDHGDYGVNSLWATLFQDMKPT